MKRQWVVTRRPCASPAPQTSSAPVHTLVIQRNPGAVRRSQSITTGLSTSRRVPCPPGTSSTSSAGASASA